MTTHQANAINLHMEEERPAPAVQNPPAATARDRVYTLVLHDDGCIEAIDEDSLPSGIGEVVGPYIVLKPWRHTAFKVNIMADSVTDALNQGDTIIESIEWQ